MRRPGKKQNGESKGGNPSMGQEGSRKGRTHVNIREFILLLRHLFIDLFLHLRRHTHHHFLKAEGMRGVRLCKFGGGAAGLFRMGFDDGSAACGHNHGC